MEKWYEVAVSYGDDGSTEKIAAFDTLEDAKNYASSDDGKSLISESHVNFIFIDKWYEEEGGSIFREDSFDAIIYKENN
jgi:hypothetical protein